jgi:hypothetical protein
MNILENYLNSDMEFIASYNDITGHYLIELGEDFIYLEEDELNDNEILAWGRDNGYLEDLGDDENKNIDELRSLKSSIDLAQFKESPPSYATPSGRAFDYFSNLEIEIPPEIKIFIVDGLHPGNDWQGVIIKNMESIVMIQKLLYLNGERVNFLLK